MNDDGFYSVLSTLSNLRTIRSQAYRLFDLAKENQLNHFSLDLDKMDATALLVIEVIKEHYPTLDMPYHSRWRHFEVSSPIRLSKIEQLSSSLSPEQFSKILCELVIFSVFLDAGAGADWKYLDPDNGEQHSRSEGFDYRFIRRASLSY